ncbi:DUF4252 domain-containing protein [Faecalibacter rhinopitheci]|uniref:DUF4252 domain-containing protein n=1 Tax=Faecalibacter rhinopitheci TaxID=2779678 RepID=A0A8J7G9U1_9FLAO|nr:DUF4252 domain-containing protein [Faecalibacter rhinopitheci]MBF0598160.1 DUF4252 domain-containing protein [Faecalibacter rhinopitheci]
MKKIIFLFAIVTASFLNAQTSKFNQLFEQLQNTKGVTTISVNKGMFNMISNLKLENEVENFSEIIKGINSIKLIVVESKSNQMVQKKLKNMVKDMKLEELLAINNEGNKIKFYTEDSGAKSFKNLLLDISSGEENVFMVLDGEIKASDINKQIKIVSK